MNLKVKNMSDNKKITEETDEEILEDLIDDSEEYFGEDEI